MIRRHWKSIVFSICIVIFVIIFGLLFNDNLSIFDNLIYKYISRFESDYLTIFFKFISFFCSTYFIIFLTVLIMIFSKNRKMSFYIGLNILLCFLLNQTIKILIARPRPIGINLIDEIGYSFPSGHSMMGVAFYGFLAYLIYHKNISKKKKILYLGLFALLILLIGISRIYLGVHYASDVIGGYAISLAYLIIFIKLFYKKMEV